MATTVVVPDSVARQLRGLLELEVESAGVLLTRLARAPDGTRKLLVTSFAPVPDEEYATREATGLTITSGGYVPALGQAERERAVPLWFHTHPGSGASPTPSRRDKRVDHELAPLFQLRAESPYYGALILAHDDGKLTFTGHLESAEERSRIDRLMVVGARLELFAHHEDRAADLPALFDRNIRAFGGDVQRVLRALRVAVVGCGGTGSSVAEQLVRLGVREFILLDPDVLAESNITRLYGSTSRDVGRPKVEVLADHLRRISPDCVVEAVASMATVEAAARDLVAADIIFGCTDDNAGRLVLSRLAYYMLIPVIDCGVLLTNDLGGHINGIHGRVTALHPGAACLVCRGRIDLARASSELLTPEERNRRVDEGYAPALEGVEPAVVSYTTLVAATAVAELIERLTGYGGEPVPSEILLRIHDREISTNTASPQERHYCDPSAGKLGKGDTDPFLEQTWAA